MQIPQLTFWRFLGSIAVVALHFGLVAFPVNTNVLQPLIINAVSALTFFFALSGFIMVIAHVKEGQLGTKIDYKSFWIKRAARILPIYWISILLYFVVAFSFDPDLHILWQLQPYGFSTLLLQSWYPDLTMDVNFPAWSLSVEAFFYLLFPWIYSRVIKLKDGILIGLSGGFWILSNLNFYLLVNEGFSMNFAKFLPPFHLATFVLGICSGIVFVRNYERIKSKYKGVIISSTLALLTFLLISAYMGAGFYKYQHNGLLAPFFCLAFIALAISKGPFIQLLSNKRLVYLGDLSYSIYILQVPIYLLTIPFIETLTDSISLQFILYLLALIFISSISYRGIEVPGRKWVMQKFSSKK